LAWSRLDSDRSYQICPNFKTKPGSSTTAALDKSNGNVRAVQRLSRHADLRTVQLYDDNRQNLQEQITDLLEDALED
jgi:integrase